MLKMKLFIVKRDAPVGSLGLATCTKLNTRLSLNEAIPLQDMFTQTRARILVETLFITGNQPDPTMVE